MPTTNNNGNDALAVADDDSSLDELANRSLSTIFSEEERSVTEELQESILAPSANHRKPSSSLSLSMSRQVEDTAGPPVYLPPSLMVAEKKDTSPASVFRQSHHHDDDDNDNDNEAQDVEEEDGNETLLDETTDNEIEEVDDHPNAVGDIPMIRSSSSVSSEYSTLPPPPPPKIADGPFYDIDHTNDNEVEGMEAGKFNTATSSEHTGHYSYEDEYGDDDEAGGLVVSRKGNEIDGSSRRRRRRCIFLSITVCCVALVIGISLLISSLASSGGESATPTTAVNTVDESPPIVNDEQPSTDDGMIDEDVVTIDDSGMTTDPPPPPPPPCQSSVFADRSCYAVGEHSIYLTLLVCHPKDGDWIGIYEENDDGGGVDIDGNFLLQDDFVMWSYTCSIEDCPAQPGTDMAVTTMEMAEYSKLANNNVPRRFRAFLVRTGDPPPYLSDAKSDVFTIVNGTITECPE